MSSQCRVSFQAFVAAPTMKCVCPPKTIYPLRVSPPQRGGGGERARERAEWPELTIKLTSQKGRRAREQGLFTGLHTQQGPGTGRYVSLATPLSSTLRHAQLHFHSEAPFVSFQILAFSLFFHKLV